MRWSLLNRASSQLSTTIENANFEFYGKTLTGAVKQRPSDERVLQLMEESGSFRKLYVEKCFRLKPKPKQRK
jgi:endothelin-converting enzyme/putative endopeptidase